MKKRNNKTEKNILIAFLINISFSLFEFFGGMFTRSVAIMSDSLHDFGDALSIGISYGLEKKSKKNPDNKYTYGYVRYSVLGGVITTSILLVGSLIVIYNSIKRLLNPTEVNYKGMLIFAIIGVVLNILAAFFTKEGDSLNQKSVNLHMLEDVLGWIVVLFGSIIMYFTDISILDPLMSIGVAIFILVNALSNLKVILDLFLEKTPSNIDIDSLKKHIMEINEVEDVHHIHVWSIDGYNNYATMHVVTKNDEVKKLIRNELKEHGIVHAIIETDKDKNSCSDKKCHVNLENTNTHIHHHH